MRKSSQTESWWGKASVTRWHLSGGFKGYEGISHVEIQGRAFSAKSTAGAKALSEDKRGMSEGW